MYEKFVNSCNFFAKNAYTKKLSRHVFFFVLMHVTGLHDLLQKKLRSGTIFLVTRIYRKKKRNVTSYNIHAKALFTKLALLLPT